MLKLAPFCIGGNSMKVLASFADFLLHKDKAPELDRRTSRSRRATRVLPLDMPVRSNGSRRRLTRIGQSTFTVAPSQPFG